MFGVVQCGVLIVVLGVILTPWVDAGCADKDICCQKKDNKCRSKGPRMNNANSKTCFCDESCLFLGDCCTDYKTYCTSVDCKVGEWGEYEGCDKACGWSVEEKRKAVYQEPRNGGKKCGPVVEKRACFGWNCKQQRSSIGLSELRENARVMPAAFGSWRNSKKYNPYKDIRKNLFHHYSANAIIQRPPYYSKFEITKTRGNCTATLKNGQTFHLEKGQMLCVECQQLAMKRKLGVRCRGDGVYLKETRWNAVTISGCHGKWVQKTREEDGTCDATGLASLILL